MFMYPTMIHLLFVDAFFLFLFTFLDAFLQKFTYFFYNRNILSSVGCLNCGIFGFRLNPARQMNFMMLRSIVYRRRVAYGSQDNSRKQNARQNEI